MLYSVLHDFIKIDKNIIEYHLKLYKMIFNLNIIFYITSLESN
jgi:hypothetical protein